MRKLILALIISHFLTIAYTALFAIDEKLPYIRANFFLNKAAMPQGIELGWYVKYITDHIVWCVTFAVLSAVAYKVSRKMFIVASLFGIYHLLDFICFLVDFNQSWWIYYTLLSVLGLALIFLLLPIKDSKAKVVSME